MPSYTIIGATGNTGGALLQLLLKAPNTHINVYIRSRSKLLQQNPGIGDNTNVTIVEGALSNIPLLASVLSAPLAAAFCVTGMNENIPGMRIAQDTAHSVVAALCQNRSEKANIGKPPRLIFLSSVSVNERIRAQEPFLVNEIISRAFSYNYADLILAEQYLRLHDSWLECTFIQPGALVDDVQKGHRLSLEGVSPFVSYLDLAAGMIEVAESGAYAWAGVCVMATGKDIRFETKAPSQILRGLVWHFLPWLYWSLHYLRLL